MEFGDLGLYTTQELVDELLRRRTFLGVVVHSATDLKQGWEEEQVFRVRFNSNLSREEATRLLDVVSESMDREWQE